MTGILGWDIGGANLKAAWLPSASGEAGLVRTASRPFEIWRGPGRLQAILQEVAAELAPGPPRAIALTMTAELADVFSTKREGVLFVLRSLAAAFPDCPCYV